MSRDATIEIVFAGDVRTFKLTIENLLALEEACDDALPNICERLSTAKWFIRDITNPIRIGLIGAGVDPKIAKRMVDENIVPGRLDEHVIIAYAIVMAARVGNPREQVGKEKRRRTRQGRTNASPPPPSTETVQP